MKSPLAAPNERLAHGAEQALAESAAGRGLAFCSEPTDPRARWYPELPNQENDMDKDRIKGSAEQAKGKVKEWAGKITGDSKTEAEGKADQVKGKVQNTIGGIKDTVRGE
jgi:uncharacterized protein YjbJ (UPF0337 family)